jgi:hypothetical protein
MEDLLRRAAEYLQEARKLPRGADRNELRQIALGLKWMAKRKLGDGGEIRSDSSPN